jgi:hypothetical protein
MKDTNHGASSWQKTVKGIAQLTILDTLKASSGRALTAKNLMEQQMIAISIITED